MAFFYFLAVFLLAMRLRKMLKFSNVFPKWKNMLNYSWLVMVLFAILQSKLDHGYCGLLGSAILLGALLYLNKQPDFAPFKFYIQAHYPLVAVGFIDSFTEIIAPDFYEKWQTYFVCAVFAAFAWIYARWVTSKKQREELLKATARNNELDRLVNERTAELTKQKNELQETLKLLQATQAQLIQSEKLASLGELTAGIAHEIQNPLNFVNNFSEVSMELIDEMEEELNKGDKDEAMAIATDIKQNLEKIIHHGKRADGIVKGMLQHSRASNNVKEPTDINKLADEYLRLSYHGLRAKDKTFNAELATHFAPDLPMVSMVHQDVGRVLLNLFTNAFYATQQKKNNDATGLYKPTVEVSTSAKGKTIAIKVKDNGTGIPDEVKDKIMQPFFTTKPTGEGTGLGLSLSYDIVVKGHGGSIEVDSVAGEGSEFIIYLPII
jgi:signal transduction histidine kinase